MSQPSDSSEEESRSTSWSSDDCIFILEELDGPVDGGTSSYVHPTYLTQQERPLKAKVTRFLGNAMWHMPKKKHESFIIHVKEAKKENMLPYMDTLPASAPELCIFMNEKVILSSQLPPLPHSFPPTKASILKPQPPILYPVMISPLPTLSPSLAPISPPLDVLPSSLLPTPSPPLPSNPPPTPTDPTPPPTPTLSPILHSTPSKLPPLPTLSPILPSTPSKLPPLPTLSPILPSTPSKLPPLPRRAHKTFSHTSLLGPWAFSKKVAPLPPITRSAQAEEVKDEAEAREAEAEAEAPAEVAEDEQKEKPKRRFSKNRFFSFLKKLNCFSIQE